MPLPFIAVLTRHYPYDYLRYCPYPLPPAAIPPTNCRSCPVAALPFRAVAGTRRHGDVRLFAVPNTRRARCYVVAVAVPQYCVALLPACTVGALLLLPLLLLIEYVIVVVPLHPITLLRGGAA